MVRLFGRSFGSKSSRTTSLSQPSSSSTLKPKKKRLSPSARTPQGRREHHPMFQYAMDEYAQTVVHQDDYHDDENDYEGGSQHGRTNIPLQPSLSADLPQPPTRGHDPSRRSQQHRNASSSNTASSSFCYYEESFGPAYTGGILTYIYPSGYQSMRPRSAPWKLSIVVFILFTWLSVFIVGHCSDMSAAWQNQQNQQQQQQDNGNDNDVVVSYDDLIDNYNARWCGSRPLYWLWVASMLITGFSASYCSIIGYIKVRDFAVANVRSQPCASVGDSSLCGVVKSDYYVRIQNNQDAYHRGGSVVGSVAEQSQGSGSHGSASTQYQYQQSIYQSDGTPQFWGAHIYRPTQAAVAVTSR